MIASDPDIHRTLVVPVRSAGYDLPAYQIAAVSEFARSAKANSYWDKIAFCGHFLGDNNVTARYLTKAHAYNVSPMPQASTLVTDSQFSLRHGYSPDGTNNKILKSNMTPSYSVSAMSSVDTIATVTTSAANPLRVGDPVRISGASTTQHNGLFTVCGVTSTTVFCVTLGSAITATSTGTMVACVGPWATYCNTSMMIAVDSRNNASTATSDWIGVLSLTAGTGYMIIRNNAGTIEEYTGHTAGATNAPSAISGFYVANRVSNTDSRLYKNGTQIGSTYVTDNSATLMPDKEFWIGGRNNNSSVSASKQRQFAFYVGTNFTATDVVNLSTAHAQLMADLRRA